MKDSLYVSCLPAVHGWGRLSLWDLSSPLSDSMLQFPDTVEFSEEMANLGKTVIVAALDATFQRKVRPSCFWHGGAPSETKNTSPALSMCTTSCLVCFAAVWEHPEPGSSGRERGEAARRLHAVLQRSCLHQEDWSGEGGEPELQFS